MYPHRRVSLIVNRLETFVQGFRLHQVQIEVRKLKSFGRDLTLEGFKLGLVATLECSGSYVFNT